MHGMLLQVLAASRSTAAAQNYGQSQSQAEVVDWKHLQVHQCPVALMIRLALDMCRPMPGCASLCYA